MDSSGWLETGGKQERDLFWEEPTSSPFSPPPRIDKKPEDPHLPDRTFKYDILECMRLPLLGFLWFITCSWPVKRYLQKPCLHWGLKFKHLCLFKDATEQLISISKCSTALDSWCRRPFNKEINEFIIGEKKKNRCLLYIPWNILHQIWSGVISQSDWSKCVMSVLISSGSNKTVRVPWQYWEQRMATYLEQLFFLNRV